MNKKFINEYVEIRIDNNILFLNYLTETLSLEVSQETMLQRLRFCDDKNYPMILDMRNVKSIDRNSREYLARPECLHKLWAVAFIVESVFQEVTATIYLNLCKPSIPTKLFKGENAAVEWIHSLPLWVQNNPICSD